MTDFPSLTPPKLETSMVERACALLAQGQLVGMPTETVYGLAGDATNALALARIFETKGRPSFNPLIIHSHNIQSLESHVCFHDKAYQLAKAFWPGPLTLVLKRQEHTPIDLLASAGMDTLGVRVPKHPAALALLKAYGSPLAAPSANLSNQISPTSASMVLKDFPHLFVLDGDACTIGLESTIIGFQDQTPIVYRLGGISLKAIERVLQEPIKHFSTPKKSVQANATFAPAAPGMLSKHYAPRTPLRMNAVTCELCEIYIAYGKSPYNTPFNLSAREDLSEAASHLFRMMYEADMYAQRHGLTGIAVAPIPHHDLGQAINDRLMRASHR